MQIEEGMLSELPRLFGLEKPKEPRRLALTVLPAGKAMWPIGQAEAIYLL